MQAIIARARANLKDKGNLADDDEAFHLALISAAKNPILLRIAKSLYLMTRSVRHAYFEAAGSGAQSVREHMPPGTSASPGRAPAAAGGGSPSPCGGG